MNIRTVNDIKTLDDELNLFEENRWDFMSVIDTQEVNFEYFDDIRDSDFTKREFTDRLTAFFGVGLFIITVCLCIIIVQGTGVFDNTDYTEASNLQTSISGITYLDRIDGDEASSEELIDIQSVVNTYMRTIKFANSYDALYACCKDTSTFADTYNYDTENIVELYDKYDCKARGLREFGSACTLNKVNDIIKKDGTYYCYVTISTPSDDDISQFIYQHQYLLTKKFTAEEPTEEAIFEYLLNILDNSPLPTTSQEYCIKFVNNGGRYTMLDDSFFTSLCMTAYTDAVYKASQVLGVDTEIEE
jgi:hypothetical protein